MPQSSPSRRRLLFSAIAFVLLAAFGGYLVWIRMGLPVPGSPRYEQYVDAFQLGVAALDADLPDVAEEHLTQAIGLIPQEPAGWADRGLLYVRTNRLPDAARDLAQAQSLAPRDPAVLKLLGLLEQHRGRFAEGADYLRQAVELDPNDVKALYLLAQIIAQDQQQGSDAEYQRLMERILAARSDNLRVLVDRLRVAARRSDAEAVGDSLVRFRELASAWSDQTRTSFKEFEHAQATDPSGAETLRALLRFSNVLRGEPDFARHSAEVDSPDARAGDSLQVFIKLAPVSPTPAPPDTELAFTPHVLPESLDGRWDVVLPIWLTGEGEPVVFAANSEEVRRGDSSTTLPSLPVAFPGVVSFDWNNDARTDFLLAGAEGLRFHQQRDDRSFLEIGPETGLPHEIMQGSYAAALAADVDLDGDLDVLVSRRAGSPLFLRNNFDGTFMPQPIFAELDGPQNFAWADFDHDGVSDAALLDANGRLHFYANERSTRFRVWPAAPPGGRFLAFTVADANDDGVLDLVALRDDGALVSISDSRKRTSWTVAELVRWAPAGGSKSSVSLLAADLDNNGAIDLLASGSESSAIWLGAGGGRFQSLPAELPPRLVAAADLRGVGRLDLLGLEQDGRPLCLRNSGRRAYHWQRVRLQASREKSEGDNRINSFGIGGEIELRTGTHVVKLPIVAPVVHFGLGERSRADVVRIQWPNGTSQVEFGTPIDQTIVAVQRLKGSCPFLFAWNGRRHEFVTDFMWSTPLGMYINAANTGSFVQTTDWVKVPGDQLVARGGEYELRVNANLWETHYFDHLALLVVDHPPDTEMHVDERFYMEPAAPALHLTQAARKVARAWDHHGRDAMEEVRSVDGVHLDRCGRGTYQGVTREHWVEVDLGDDAPAEGPLWLLARGWVHPTDSSVNYALEQGVHDRPFGLVLEIPDGQGGWKTGRDRLGFPAGKNKTIMVRLDGLDGPGVSRRFRLRTNMEIYWDAIQYARGFEDAAAGRQRLLPLRADLRFRGIVAMTQANPSSPELPDYDRVVARGQYWRDLIGFHTRYGEVRELLEEVDDRYAMLCGGDEIALHFAAPAPPPDGWRRDFVWIADGWVKDGDFNTQFGKTVLPLPAHDLDNYNNSTLPGRLEDDPVFRRHPLDWEIYHTRFVAPYAYEHGLRSFGNSRQP